uniref:NADH-ubiquinone oxidoreductase chain 3 n=1 Tax=Paradyschiria parvula TaxID=2572155 RepID=A0A5B9RU59_9MUSC|nr:NADH dehydrogenase subunit 3 [Paradyschiria parvula]QEG77637.1 NADH dehydrogenase subunit 3 [Paradyschiria parvula]
MLIIISINIIILFISFIIMFIASTISKKTKFDREKFTPFECGFDPFSSSRLPFSLRFFLIAILFLIFDVEITLIMPTILIMKFTNLTSWTLTISFFLIILLFGVYHEWHQGILKWVLGCS